MLALIVSLKCAAPRTTSAAIDSRWALRFKTTNVVTQTAVTTVIAAEALTPSRFHHCTGGGAETDGGAWSGTGTPA
jgi:hypothetical protein